MSFANPLLFFLAIIPFLLLLFLKRRQRRVVSHSNLKVAKKARGIREFLRRLPKILLFLIVILLSFAFTRPQTLTLEIVKETIEAREFGISIDGSGSMSDKIEGTEERLIDRVVKEAKKFVKERITHDLVGITVFQNNSALQMILPTLDYNLIENSLDALGNKVAITGSTPIGEGLFMSLMALIEREMGDDFDPRKVKESIKTKEKEYALQMVKKIGKLKNKVIILYTDGEHNTGLEPADVFWLIERLGVKVYFIAPKAVRNQEKALEIKNRVIKSGGRYFETGSPEDIEKFYKEVDKLEKAEVIIERAKRLEDKFTPFIIPVFVLLILLVIAYVSELRIP